MIMEKNREARSSSSVVAANGPSRRRSRATAFRDLPEEGQVELQETVRLRDRGGKRDRDREFASRSKRRGGGNREEEVEEEEGGDTSAEDIVADGDSDEVEEGGGVSRILSSTTTASSVTNQNQRRNYLPPRVAKQQWKVVDDAMIGVPVPRKARSASVKRSHDCTVSGNSGVGGAGEDIADDHSHRNQSDSPARSSAEVVSPSTSIISAKRKMKPTGPKTRSMKTSKDSSPSAKEGDIEIEIAEVLFGLKKQPQCSKKQEVNMKQSSKQETENSSVLPDGSKSSVTSTTGNSAETTFQKSVSHQKNGAISDLSQNVAGEKKKLDSSPLDGAAKGEFEKPAEIEIYSSKLEAASEESKPGKEVCTGEDENKGSKKTRLAQDVTSCAKGDVDPEDSPPTKSIPEAVTQKEEKFKFDLMAPPSSPERDGLADMVLDAKPLNLGLEMGKDTSNRVENEAEGFKEKEKVIDEDKMVTSGIKFEFFKLDLEKPQLDSSSIAIQEQSQKQQPKGAAGTVEKNEPSTSVRLPIILGGWPTTEIPSVGYMPPFRTVLPVATVDKSSAKLQHPNFILSHPRPKRCLTHYDIARNIYLHQQFTKTNYFLPGDASSASLADAKLTNTSSKEGMPLSNPLGGNHLDVNLNSVQQREQAEGNAINDKRPEAANFADIVKSEELVFQQRQGASFGNSMSGSGFIFPIGQHQAPIGAAGANQSGSAKSSNNQSTTLFNNPEAGTLVSFPAFPAVSTNMSYSHPNVVSVEAPYLAKLQNNGYPFAFSTSAGTSSTYRASNAQPLPLFNGSFYPSQMFHPSQIQPAQTQSHHQSSGSHKQPQTQPQQWSVHVPGNNILPSNGMQVKQSTEQHLPLSNQSRKHENETSGEDATSLSEKRAAPVQKNIYGQNYILPVQALGFTLMPSPTLNNGNGVNHGEKKQSHPQNLKSTVALVPSQGLTMSFASYNGNSTPSNLNFTPIAQNTTVFQNLPDIQRTGFQVAPPPQATKQKNHQTSEGRNGVVLSGTSDRNTGNSSTKPSVATSGQTLVFGNSSRTLNFMTSSVPVNWPSSSTKSAALTSNRPAGSSSGNQQQQPLLQLPQQHIAPRMVPRTKVPTNSSLPSSATTKFPCSAPPGFSQPLIQCENSIQSSSQKNSGRMVASVVPMTSLHLASSTSVHKNSIQQKGSTPQGQTQISFGGGDFKPAYTQMQHIPTSGLSPSSSGKLRNTSSKTNPSGTPTQPKQDESSAAGAGQKSSPVCGRNVPSILNTCPSHLSELKY